MPAVAAGGGGKVTLRFHELLTRFGPDYLKQFGATMPSRQRQVLQQILRCRTPALGGELFGCPACGHFHYRYHSCNDRHCPLCGGTETDHWLEQQRPRLLLPVPYFLLTFTVPDALRSWIRSHPEWGYALLFDASAQALQDLAVNPQRLGAQLGMLGVLHTWSRTLIYHPHIHYLVPGGGLSPDQRSWIPSRPQFLLPVHPLAQHFRTRFRVLLAQQAPEQLAPLPAQLWQQNWVVHSQPAGSGDQALAYLARYVFKTATGNRPVELLPSGQVLWPYRDSRTGHAQSMTLAPTELIRRFLQHVLPSGLRRVRLFGWFHPAAKLRVNRVRALLKQGPLLSGPERQAWQLPDAGKPAEPAPSPPADLPQVCPRCGQPLVHLGSIPAWRWLQNPGLPRAP